MSNPAEEMAQAMRSSKQIPWEDKAVSVPGIEGWQYTDEGLLHGIRIAKAGGRKNIDEGTTEEQRLLRLLRIVEKSGFAAGTLAVQSKIKDALFFLVPKEK